MEHELKTWPGPWEAVSTGRKPYEIRKADRPYDVGDTLRLREWDPATDKYTGRWSTVEVTYITRGGEWGIPDGLCVMGVRCLAVMPLRSP